MSGDAHHCVTLHCALTLDKALLREAFNCVDSSKPHGDIRNVLPECCPLDMYFGSSEWDVTPKAFDGDGAIEVTEFTWSGTGSSDINALIRFAKLTKGKAEFVMVTEDGALLGYVIRDGKLYKREVVLTTRAIKRKKPAVG